MKGSRRSRKSLRAGSRELDPRADAVEIFRRAVAAADPRQAVLDRVRVEGDHLTVDGTDGRVRIPIPPPGRGRVLVVGAGKASAPMADALEALLDDRVSGGLVCVKDGHTSPLRRVELREASHPIPDERGAEAAERILGLVTTAGEGDLILSVFSGGGSALLPLPAKGVPLQDIQLLTDQLLASGASIDEINTLRKHLSRVAGGRLGVAAHPAAVVNLVLSDVVGDRLDVIASGPFSPDPSTYAEALGILDRGGLLARVPCTVRSTLESGARGELPETPKPGDRSLERVTHAIVGSNCRSLEEAARKAREMGYRPLILSSFVQGEAREVAKVLAAVAKQCHASGDPIVPPACLLAGGETTVTLRGHGLGGRNQELALGLALELDGWPDIAGLSGGTDGTDGPTDAAGAVVTGATLSRARAKNLDARRSLAENDSYRFFDALGDLIRTGPTRTNVMDVQILLVAR